MTGKKVKEKLILAGIKQVSLAGMLDISKQQLSNVLNSDSHVSSDFLERIAEALGVDMTFFYPPKVAKFVDEPPTLTNNYAPVNAQNLAQGSNNVTQTSSSASDNETIKQLLQQNADLIAILKTKL